MRVVATLSNPYGLHNQEWGGHGLYLHLALASRGRRYGRSCATTADNRPPPSPNPAFAGQVKLPWSNRLACGPGPSALPIHQNVLMAFWSRNREDPDLLPPVNVAVRCVGMRPEDPEVAWTDLGEAATGLQEELDARVERLPVQRPRKWSDLNELVAVESATTWHVWHVGMPFPTVTTMSFRGSGSLG